MRTEPALLARLGKLGVVAATSFFFNLGVTAGLTELLGIAPRISFAIALIMVFIGNFFLTRYWVFGERADPKNAAVQFRRCVIVSVTFRLAEYVVFLVLNEVLEVPYLIAVTTVLIVSFLTKAGIYDRYVFRAVSIL